MNREVVSPWLAELFRDRSFARAWLAPLGSAAELADTSCSEQAPAAPIEVLVAPAEAPVLITGVAAVSEFAFVRFSTVSGRLATSLAAQARPIARSA